MADAHAKPDPRYHVVEASPWPALGAVSAFVAAVGGITWMHHMFPAAPYIFGAGVIGILYTMLGWWTDVAREATHEGFHTQVVQISHRYGMILFIASEVMFFVAWFWAYFNSALFPADMHQITREQLFGGVWPPHGIVTFDPWHLPLINTLILLTSGSTVTWAHHAILTGDRKGAIQGLILTALLGASFPGVQAYEYNHAAFTFGLNGAMLQPLMDEAHKSLTAGVGNLSAIYGTTFFMATGFHGAHVIIGTT